MRQHSGKGTTSGMVLGIRKMFNLCVTFLALSVCVCVCAKDVEGTEKWKGSNMLMKAGKVFKDDRAAWPGIGKKGRTENGLRF